MNLPGLPSGISALFDSLFDCMDVADRELRAAEARLGRKLPGAFLALRPPELLRGRGDALYRLHVRELLGRAERGEDLRPGTLAEVAAACSDASLVAPPGRGLSALYQDVFVKLFGTLPDGGEPEREEWQGQLAELLAEARRKTAQDWRRPAELLAEHAAT